MVVGEQRRCLGQQLHRDQPIGPGELDEHGRAPASLDAQLGVPLSVARASQSAAERLHQLPGLHHHQASGRSCRRIGRRSGSSAPCRFATGARRRTRAAGFIDTSDCEPRQTLPISCVRSRLHRGFELRSRRSRSARLVCALPRALRARRRWSVGCGARGVDALVEQHEHVGDRRRTAIRHRSRGKPWSAGNQRQHEAHLGEVVGDHDGDAGCGASRPTKRFHAMSASLT